MAKHKKQLDGLSKAEVRQRKLAGLSNVAVSAPSKTIRQIIIGNVFTYFNFIFLIIALLLILVNSWRDITFLPIIIANTLIGIVQEIRSKITLDRMKILNAPSATVMRDGKERRLASEWLVKDDVVIFKAGDQIPADAKILEGEVAANESLLTGEAIDIKKSVGDELLSGSFIVSGRCYAKLTRVGRESYISQLTLEAKKEKKHEESEIIRSLNRIVILAGAIVVPVGLILFCQRYFGDGATAQRSVQTAVAAVIGLIPEGLFLLSSVALAISATKLAQQKVLPQDMRSIETLARVDVLCVDKTGTITDARMKIASLELARNTKISYKEAFGLVSDFAQAQEADNETMKAIKDFFTQPTGRTARSVAGFSSDFKYSGVNFENDAYVLGAPELVLRERYGDYAKDVEDFQARGYRVVVFGKYHGSVDGRQLTEKVDAVGWILIMNPVRASAADTFSYFEKQGVEIKVISGDAPRMVSEVAKQAKIKHADRYIDATSLIDKSSPEHEAELVRNAIRKYTIFGRVKPEQKRQLIQALQADGKTVAMTGDGVNDILALREANCSIAMASGSEAAVQASKLVLMESDFSKMPEVVYEGRRVVNNLERSGSLFLVKNVFSLLTALIAIIFGIAYPLVPAQVSMISFFTIGMPAFLLSQLPNTDLIRGNFVRNILFRAIPGGLTDAIIVALMMFFGRILAFQENEISTASTALLAIVGIIMVYRAAKPLDWRKWAIWGLCVIGVILSFIIAPQFFNLSPISWLAGVTLGLIALLIPAILKWMTSLTRFGFRKFDTYLEKSKVVELGQESKTVRAVKKLWGKAAKMLDKFGG
ncbi:HAD-IC family P-type ATPase [Candidatus Saccharibacteria bacterium]|nr:HAD-IC family P-type ATPase [Candidatus Saccharibacteria bacterium]